MSIADKLTTIAENVPKVYEAGQKSEYDRFWDAYQENGNRVRYELAFSGYGWTDENFSPKYDLKPTSAPHMFNMTNIVDLFGTLNKQGVILDFSECTGSMMQMCISSKIAKMGIVDIRKSNNTNQIFDGCGSLTYIEKLIVRETNTYSSIFRNCKSLQNITIEGVIGNNIDIHWSPLTHDSIMSIINHLQTKTSGTFTLTLGSTNLAKLTDAEKAIATEKGWTLA